MALMSKLLPYGFQQLESKSNLHYNHENYWESFNLYRKICTDTDWDRARVSWVCESCFAQIKFKQGRRSRRAVSQPANISNLTLLPICLRPVTGHSHIHSWLTTNVNKSKLAWKKKTDLLFTQGQQPDVKSRLSAWYKQTIDCKWWLA